MAGKARRTKGGKQPDDLRGEFTIVAVPGTHRDRTKGKYGAGGSRRPNRNRLSKAQKQKILLEARVEGKSWREAAKMAGYGDPGNAWRAAQEAIADIPREAADEARSLEMQRIDAIVHANWRSMELGDTDAANVILRAIDRRAKLLGLDLQEPPPGLTLDVTLQSLILRLVGLEPAEVESELNERLELLAADAEDDQRAASRNGHGNGTGRQAVSGSIT